MYGDEDRNNVIELFEAVRVVYIERDHIKANRLAAATTATILSDIKHYSNIQARTILRWYGNKGKECLKPGPKITPRTTFWCIPRFGGYWYIQEKSY